MKLRLKYKRSSKRRVWARFMQGKSQSIYEIKRCNLMERMRNYSTKYNAMAWTVRRDVDTRP